MFALLNSVFLKHILFLHGSMSLHVSLWLGFHPLSPFFFSLKTFFSNIASFGKTSWTSPGVHTYRIFSVPRLSSLFFHFMPRPHHCAEVCLHYWTSFLILSSQPQKPHLCSLVSPAQPWVHCDWLVHCTSWLDDTTRYLSNYLPSLLWNSHFFVGSDLLW